jgi:DNA-binding transcriptional regulator YiaG
MTPQQFRQLRETLGLSQTAWAECLGVSRSTVAKIEGGRQSLTGTMARLAEAIRQGYRPEP